MPRDNSRQARQGKQGVGERERPRPVRSPALESAERRRARRTGPGGAGGRKQADEQRRYAVEEGAPRVAPRKALPPLKRHVNNDALVSSGGLTVGWRSSNRARTTGPDPQPARVISEEEEQQLAQLEMSMPRVAGRIDPWLLIIVMALLAIGVVMVYSSSSFLAASYTGDAGYYFQRELMWVGLGIVVMLV
ncbi:MAG TPA: hypothetical protein VF458_19925, partial [Ktedonobacteraceae bacterium]